MIQFWEFIIRKRDQFRGEKLVRISAGSLEPKLIELIKEGYDPTEISGFHLTDVE